ncbi:hypothetical protein PoB_005170000 [Plakobranchus ocellatus]|uniref:Uncharacterized protein n=1 Tax=Plakobranchus ocellatus TaxID=259542 RepID=A0AAV4BXR1_9GAST|nr:hypothetical protein PoB_005170000 [Plakobranchus ocellatus]
MSPLTSGNQKWQHPTTIRILGIDTGIESGCFPVCSIGHHKRRGGEDREIISVGQQQDSNFIEELFVKRVKPVTNSLYFPTNIHGLSTKGALVS